ncbi:MAG: hypothetical protein ACREKL_00685 [Chthoniobacterales bacterium]
MKTTAKSALVASAIAGLLSGSAAVAANTGTQSASQNHIAGVSMKVMDDKGTHSCKGQNDCKGQGGCKGSGDSCKGKNDCKGKGGCATDGSKK